MKYTHNITRCSLLGALALCGALLSATGCSKDPETVTEGQILAFSVSGDNFELAPQTKAVKFTSESTGNITSIYVSGWNGATRIIPAATETDNDYDYFNVTAEGTGTVKYLAKTEVAWAAPYERTFYAYANIPAEGVTFECSSSAQQTLTYYVPAEASAQRDILMASYVGDGTRSGKERIAPLAFRHPLTAVSFVRGSSFADITAVKYIELDGVYAGGTLTHTADKTTGGSFSWSGTGTQTVSQTVSGLPASAGDAIGEPFIFIPQSGTNHTMKMTVTIGGKDVDLTGTISAPTWEAGSSYTYKIDYAGAGTGFYITITDWDINEIGSHLEPGDKPQGVQLWENGPYWAKVNIGASSPTDRGAYFYWGDITPYMYDETNHSFDVQFSAEGYAANAPEAAAISADITPTSGHDAAREIWGGDWRMPTKEEFSILTHDGDSPSCYWVQVSQYNGVSCKGFVVYRRKPGDTVNQWLSKSSGVEYTLEDDHIFISSSSGLAYWADNNALQQNGNIGYLWTSKYSTSEYAFFASFQAGVTAVQSNARYAGCPIRPVYTDPNATPAQ